MPHLTTGQRVGRTVAQLVVGVTVVLTVFPVLWMVRTSLTPAGNLFGDSYGLWPHHPTLINFKRVLGMTSSAAARAAGGSGAQLDFLLYLRNSLIYTIVIVVGQTLSCAMAGYALARLRFRGRTAVFGTFVGSLMIPPIFTLLPNFALVKQLGWLDTFPGLVAPTLLMSPFSVFFLRQFFLSIPREVEEAALLDGASRARIFWSVVLPMSRAPLFTISLTLAVWSWKDFLWPLLVGRAENTRVLTAALCVFLQQSPNAEPDWTGLMAASTLTVVPPLLLLIFFGRRLVDAVGFTGVK